MRDQYSQATRNMTATASTRGAAAIQLVVAGADDTCAPGALTTLALT
jgi:hypothetical protein